MSPVVSTTAAHMRDDFEINTIGPLVTFQGLWPFLQKSKAPKYVVITSSLGSIAAQEPVPAGAYGPSKAAANWVTRALHLQMDEAGLVSVGIHPGFVKTDMGAFAAGQWNNVIQPNVSVKQSVQGILEIVDEATKDKHSGQMVTFDGQVIPW
jgi:NAD(P)-dependent dehydrogenase (short-subunit alcohol dehydrogenase family)